MVNRLPRFSLEDKVDFQEGGTITGPNILGLGQNKPLSHKPWKYLERGENIKNVNW